MLVFAAIGMFVVVLVVASGTARAAWQEIAQFLSLLGDPEPASANVLSEHEIEVLDRMAPQHQAELAAGTLDQPLSRRERADRWRAWTAGAGASRSKAG